MVAVFLLDIELRFLSLIWNDAGKAITTTVYKDKNLTSEVFVCCCNPVFYVL